MPLPIWTPDGLSSEARPYRGRCWRLVEAQHRVSTLKLVDTLEEQALLEDLIEETKPAVPPECRHLDYLFSTPFRYGALYPHGSRFRRAGRTLGVYYAAEEARTAVAEMAFYRLLFFAESPDTPWPSDSGEYTAFAAEVATGRSIDLAATPFSEDEARWMHPTDYAATQDVADAARAAAIEIVRYRSARDTSGFNLALLTCRAFAESRPVERQTWRLRLGSSGVQAICQFPEMSIGFDRHAFSADPRLAGFNWDRGK
ncbi:RES family NAD+ phosphorylase [Chelativorans sp. AA-79]|uniref:RES family NAD+ phosphorylase n=1 Tax=Chelativorans sp. AA-79 TaxID=3028735 RepID=UPI0023F7FBD3|nr:RES family NAD+ phosphorylase [Chelativorans sp. AA-79]WEX08198.1 RES family NAD+ phosphorylase [Chelativorans sp. AA-79]